MTVFDSASWNGIAIDSTCGGHGTCHKCKVRIEGDALPITRHDVRTFSPDQIADGWRLACLVQATRDLKVDVPAADHAAQGRDRRRRPPGDPAARRSRSGTSSSTSRRWPTSAPTWSG